MTIAVGHCNDGGIQGTPGDCDRLLQVGGERGYSATTRQGIANERYPASWYQREGLRRK
jgi:hypothetical protein